MAGRFVDHNVYRNANRHTLAGDENPGRLLFARQTQGAAGALWQSSAANHLPDSQKHNRIYLHRRWNRYAGAAGAGYPHHAGGGNTDKLSGQKALRALDGFPAFSAALGQLAAPPCRPQASIRRLKAAL